MAEPEVASSSGAQISADLRRRNVQRTERPSPAPDTPRKSDKEIKSEVRWPWVRALTLETHARALILMLLKSRATLSSPL